MCAACADVLQTDLFVGFEGVGVRRIHPVIFLVFGGVARVGGPGVSWSRNAFR